MAWTTLPTQSAGGTASAAGWANVVKADLEALYAVRKMKVADESVSNNTLQNDNDFLFTVAANEKWAVDITIKLDTTTTADWKFAWTVPAGTTYQTSVLYANAPAFLDYTTASAIVGATSANAPMRLQSYFLVAATPGIVQFQWAQDTTFGTPTLVKAGSWMNAMRCD